MAVTSLNPLGACSEVHEVPSLVVPTTKLGAPGVVPAPAAEQLFGSGQVTLWTAAVPAGSVTGVQVLPPSLVANPLAAAVGSFWPAGFEATARHTSLLAHEMARRASVMPPGTATLVHD
jgi:hypothetical protein